MHRALVIPDAFTATRSGIHFDLDQALTWVLLRIASAPELTYRCPDRQENATGYYVLRSNSSCPHLIQDPYQFIQLRAAEEPFRPLRREVGKGRLV